MRIHDPKMRNMAHALSLSVFFAFLFAIITAAGIVSCAGHKSLPVLHQ